jgi:hypothetical protein
MDEVHPSSHNSSFIHHHSFSSILGHYIGYKKKNLSMVGLVEGLMDISLIRSP